MNRRPFIGGIPLQVKLTSAVLALVTVALLLIAGVSAVALRNQLLSQAEKRASDFARQLETGQVVLVSRQTLPSELAVCRVYGSVININTASNWTEAQQPDIPAEAELRHDVNKATIIGSRGDSNRWLMVVRPQRDGTYLVVAASLDNQDQTIDRLITAEVIVGIGVLAVLASLGVGIVQASLKPLNEIERTAVAIAAGDLSRRMPDSEPDTEIHRLANALNTMLAQIEWAFAARAASEERMRQFVADASHELRTPLTTIRGFAELYRQGAVQTPEATAALLERIEGEASRMGLLVEDLLQLARLDQERPLTLAPVELRALASDAVTAARAVAPDREITLQTGDEAVIVIGDEPRLRQVIGNLVTNALTHTPAGSPVTVRVRTSASHAMVEVSDAGPGLTPEQQRRVFERFYRVDKARTRQAASAARGTSGHSGSGLGLSIVAAIVAAHRGAVLVDSAPGAGATFAVRLPKAPAELPESEEDY